MIQRCFECGERFSLDEVVYTCASCGGVLEVALDEADLHSAREALHAVESDGGANAADAGPNAGVWRYAGFLPADPDGRVSLGEGGTGLHACERLAAQVGVPRLFVKNEGENPTGSFKDRGMTVGVTKAAALGAQIVACASTGNTSASMAAYAAVRGMRAAVLIPAGKVAAGKLAQAVVYGANIVQVSGNFDDAMRLVHDLSVARGDVYLLNSINPFRLEGQKTLAFEVCEALGRAPDAVVLPMGNAGNISAIWKGFKEFHAAGFISSLPRMIGVQAEGAAPIVRAWRQGLDECREDHPETVATAIRIGAPVNWKKAVAAIRESGGHAATVTDGQILDAQRELARLEGRFVEPASAAPIAYLREHGLRDAETVVCVATGHGLKDPDAIMRSAPEIVTADPTLESLETALRLPATAGEGDAVAVGVGGKGSGRAAHVPRAGGAA